MPEVLGYTLITGSLLLINVLGNLIAAEIRAWARQKGPKP